MKTATHQAIQNPESANFRADYLSTLQAYISHGDEAALGRGYEIGRKAMAEGKSLMDISAVHHQALQEILSSGTDLDSRHALEAGSHFLAETLSPYEMAHRGFQD